MDQLKIIGCGMAGLLAAQMLKRYRPQVYEQQSALPNNHSAVLRFRTPAIGDIVGAPFREVKLVKDIANWRNPVADALAYSYKANGTYRSDRSITKGAVAGDARYVAPPDLIAHMAAGVEINYNSTVTDAWFFDGSPVISTMPMPALMKLLPYRGEHPPFQHVNGANLLARINNCDAYISLLVPHPSLPFTRISITGDSLIVEGGTELKCDEPVLAAIAELLGIERAMIVDPVIRRQPYAKILPVDNNVRKRFMAWATDNYNVFSLGRFATWRPALLNDELIKDIRLIERWAYQDDRYHMRSIR